MIFRIQKQIFSIMASTNANSFIYYFKRIPLIGKILPDSIYGNITLKNRVSGIAMILRMIGKILGLGILIGLFTVLPTIWIEKDVSLRLPSFIHIYVMFSLIGSFLNSEVFNANRNKYICIRLMRMDAKKFIVSTSILNIIMESICSLPIVLFAILWMHGTPLQSVIMMFWSMVFNTLGEAFFLFVYAKTKTMLSKKALNIILVAVFGIAITYIPALLHKPFPIVELLFNPFINIFIILLGAYSLYKLINCEEYYEIARETLKVSSFTVDGAKLKELEYQDVAIREKDYSEAELNSKKYDSKTGFAYLNAIFFERHRRLLVKPIIIRLCIIAVLFIAAVILFVFEPEITEALQDSGKILPIFVFIMYFASIGERVCKAMFYNCDISLLKYQFYRERKAVISNFKVRLCRIARLNLIVAIAISVAIVSLVLIFKVKWSVLNIIIFVLTILLLALFFSVHHLFLYYVFQPYSTEAGMKNPFYSIINWTVYFLCYFCMKIKSPPSYFALIVLSSTIIYIIVALLLVYKYSPKTFRVK